MPSSPLRLSGGFVFFLFAALVSLHLRFVHPQFVGNISGCILHFADGFAGLALGLVGDSFSLRLSIPSPFARLAFDASFYVFHFSLNALLVHFHPPHHHFVVESLLLKRWFACR